MSNIRNRLDLTGQRFGYVKAIKSTDQRVRNSVMWECICDCGNLCYFSAKQLKETKLKSCGCVPPRIKDLTGQVFGQLEVLSITNKRDGYQGTIWKCKCTCGNETEMSSRSLLGGNAKSCGCKSKQKNNRNRKRNHIPTFSKVLGVYRSCAKKRGASWELTEEEAYTLFKNNCHYCGAEPSNGKGRKDEEFLYSGIDRINNTQGYYTGNVVSCCKYCNVAKGDRTLEDFENYIFRLATHYFGFR